MNAIKAIISGDIIHSTALSKGIREKLYPTLDSFIKSLTKKDKIIGEMNHGDSFTLLVNDAWLALRIALKIKCYLKAYGYVLAKNIQLKSKEKKPFKGIEVRIAIGAGKLDFLNKRLGTSDGEAFQLSGRLLEKIKNSHQTLAVSTGDAKMNEELSVVFVLLDAIFSKTTPQQCQVIQRKLEGKKETDIAKELKIIQSSVNQRSTAGNWHAIETAINRFETLMKKK